MIASACAMIVASWLPLAIAAQGPPAFQLMNGIRPWLTVHVCAEFGNVLVHW